MGGDYSKRTFDPKKDFSGVLMQQGRVQLDSDWNEQVEIHDRRWRTETTDIVGRCGVPKEAPDGFEIEASGSKFTIGPGRIYVDGLLAENHGTGKPKFDSVLGEMRGKDPLPYDKQPYYNKDIHEVKPLPQGGPHLVYIDVWQREVTHLKRPDLIEEAVGVDTTTRLQTVWQVKVLPNIGSTVTCITPDDQIPGWLDVIRPTAGRVTTEALGVPSEKDLCQLPPTGGYRGLENQLYRVEIHDDGSIGTATFKWSRDNASVATNVTAITALDQLVVESTGRDQVLRFNVGDWVEITDDRCEFAGEPGIIRKVKYVNDATRTITLNAVLPVGKFPTDAQSNTHPSRHTRIRRWDQNGEVRDSNGNLIIDLDDPNSTGVIPIPAAGVSVILEHGIQITFRTDPASGKFRIGDYWVFAARTATGKIEELDREPPNGIKHHYCRLALVQWNTGGTLDIVEDCRELFPPLTDITADDVSFDPTHCAEQHPDTDFSEVDTVQDAINKICESLGAQEKCHDFLDDLRSDGIVRGENGDMGFQVSQIGSLQIRYTSGVAYVAGCRYEIPDGKIKVASSVTCQILLINQQSKVELVYKKPLPVKYALIAIISTYKGEIKRIIDARFDLTHLDEKVKRNMEKIAAKRSDRRQFVPLLVHTLSNLKYRDGRDYFFKAESPVGLTFDGKSIWVASDKKTKCSVTRIDHNATRPDSGEIIKTDAPTYRAAYDGNRNVWFTSPEKPSGALNNKVFLIDIEDHKVVRDLSVGYQPMGIAFDGDFMWVGNVFSETISVVDVATLQVVRTVALQVKPTCLAFDGQYMWIGGSVPHQPTGSIFRIEKPWGDLEQINAELYAHPYSLAFDGSHMWLSLPKMVTTPAGVKIVCKIAKINVRTLKLTELSQTIPNGLWLTFGGHYLWLLAGFPTRPSLLHKIDVDVNVIIGSAEFKGIPMSGVFDCTHLWYAARSGGGIPKTGVKKKLVG